MRVLVVAGSSGGHIYPAVSFLEILQLKRSDIEPLIVLSRRSKIKPQDFRIKYIDITPISLRPSVKNLVALFNFIKGSFQSLFILIEFRPDAVAGFGGIETVPLVLLAWVFRIKTIIHEQNVVPGKATKLLSYFVDKIAVSFEKTKEILSRYKEKIVLTGNPIRRQLRRVDNSAALGFLELDDNKFTILVAGGSLGAQRINQCFPESLGAMPDLSAIQVIHISGQNDFASVQEAYKKLKVKAEVFAFLDQMQYAYSAASLAVCRAGASTVAELINFRLPAILIPYPFAAAHQDHNAAVLKDAGSAVVIGESGLNPDTLKSAIVDLLQHREKLQLMQSNYHKIPYLDTSDVWLNIIT